jgi:hypothetical protein
MTTALAPDGSAQRPAAIFDHARDRKLIAVLALSGLGAGAKIRFDRYLNGSYADSNSATLTRTDRFLYFNFTARAATTFAAGQYRIRFYVNERPAAEVTYVIQ